MKTKTKYDVLVQVLDRLREEAPSERKSYHPKEGDIDGLNAARAKAFLHLFLKVRFGLLAFSDREVFVTEGAQDGGVDAYYIDGENRTIYFVQSKFRQTERNFEAKPIELEELIRMDVDRILDGETKDHQGNEYNSKIKQLVQQVRGLDNISRYSYRVVILANMKDVARARLQQLTGGFAAEVFDYARCYKELLFPLVTANYYTFDDLNISLNLSNKNAGAKISYTVVTAAEKLEITVVFVPTVEIAAAMHKYRNAILRFNPRSYLEHEGKGVNSEIRKSIEERVTNEFALFNNGITILSDGTYLNERIGQKDRAQLTMVNPQIINGGQTAYTLSQIYRDHQEPERSMIFGDKEVLVKIITFDGDAKLDESRRLELIEAISRATNSQTVVSKADRRSNEGDLKVLQERCFESFGIWFERKRGEFMDGVREGYIDESLIVDRNLFFRAAAIARGRLSLASARKAFVNSDFSEVVNAPESQFQKYNLALQVLRWIHEGDGGQRSRIKAGIIEKAYVALIIISSRTSDTEVDVGWISHVVDLVKRHWKGYLKFLERKHPDEKLFHKSMNGWHFDIGLYFRYRNTFISQDANDYFYDPNIDNIQADGCDRTKDSETNHVNL